jgi:hypothetical protein
MMPLLLLLLEVSRVLGIDVARPIPTSRRVSEQPLIFI